MATAALWADEALACLTLKAFNALADTLLTVTNAFVAALGVVVRFAGGNDGSVFDICPSNTCLAEASTAICLSVTCVASALV